jgi:FkbM family methyltransferase
MLDTLKFIWQHPISSHDRRAALSRYARWQIGTRLLGAPVVIPFVESTRLVCERSMTGATGNVYCGLHEFGDMGFVLHFLRPGDVFVDIGANVGSFSVLASGVVGAKSIALEPVPSTFSALRLNVAVNGLEGLIEPYCLAAGPRRGHVRLSIDRGPENGVVADSYSGASDEVAVMAVDVVIENTSPALLKVDVEGSERGVLEGASRTLLQPTLKAVLIEAHSEAIASTMSRAGFARAVYSPMTRRLDMMGPERTGCVSGTLNNLWVRDAELIRKRCSTARRFIVHGQSF